MGRSQVERNRRHGRPGSKGRGGGGRSATSGRGGDKSSAEGRHHPAPNPLHSNNEWRYQEEESTSTSNVVEGDSDSEDMFAPAYGYAEHGPAHDDVASALAGGLGEEEGTDHFGVNQTTLNLDDLARTLRKIPTAELLDMPEHIAREYDKKYGEFVNTKRAKTISELRAAASTSNNKQQTLGASAKAEKDTTGSPATRNKADSSDKEGSESAGDGTEGSAVREENVNNAGEEDLDAWLDSVI